jgi:methylated-DNA-[protein]-cysteine S-methyltransferase
MSRALGWCVFPTRIGHCGIAWGADKLVGVQLPGTDDAATRRRMGSSFPDTSQMGPPKWVRDVMDRIASHMEGRPDAMLDVPLDMTGVPEFNQHVYEISRAILPGFTRTYGEIAGEMGQPHAARAVGQALGHNPFAPVVPCHRILAAGGRSGGFSAPGGVDAKLVMLEIEKAQVNGPGLFD